MVYEPSDIKKFKEKALFWASSFSTVCIMDSNGYTDPYSAFAHRIAVGEKARYKSISNNDFDKLSAFIAQHSNEFVPGYISYDKDVFFFIPEILIDFNTENVNIEADDPQIIIDSIEATEVQREGVNFQGQIRSRVSREDYRHAFISLKDHILRGDIYEVNLCQEFYAEDAVLNHFEAYLALNSISPTPFSCYLKHDDLVIISASPERFLHRCRDHVISQPIKGTAPRGNTDREDLQIIEKLKNDPKEQSENIMIVDLVRNDLTISAQPGTVKVEELMGVYSFKQVHQLISTISCKPKPTLSSTEIIKNTFPPGSMTGAPKLSAMGFIKKYEKVERGIYSGSIGYFDGLDRFDFNVVIRTLIYDSDTGYLSFHVGGAVTAQSIEENEYNECILKASAIRQMLLENEVT